MSVQPISDRKAISAHNEPSWIRLAANAGEVGFWHFDAGTGCIDCTARCKVNLGIPVDANVTIETIRSVMHPEDREVVSARMRHAMETRGSYDVEYRVIWPDGSVHWIASRASYAEIGGRPGMVGTTIDDTERRRVEEMNRVITTHVAEGVLFMDAEGRFTFVNPATEQLLGWTEAELLGRVVHDTVHYKRPDGSPYPVEECPLRTTLATGVPITNVEEHCLHKDGRFIPVSFSATPIMVDGRISGTVVSMHDISERARMEDALREASRARDEFLATVSHELRTPMTSILGWAQLLKTMPLSDDLRLAVEQIELSAKAQATIVDDLIDISRAVAGKLRLHVDRVDAVTVLHEVMHMVENTAVAKKISLTEDLGCDDAFITADRGRLHQVLWNLLSNAIKFTPEGGAVKVGLRCPDERLTITVQDTGIGIAPEFLPYVFDRFSQQSATSSRQHGGLGLGLAIVKQLVEMHGGTVSADSEGSGKGATFTVVLPRR
jgi:PAS domain S-box-containing protein